MSFFNPSWDHDTPTPDATAEPATPAMPEPDTVTEPADAGAPEPVEEDTGADAKPTHTRSRAKRSSGITRRDITRILECDQTLTGNPQLGALMEQLAGEDRAQQIEQVLDGKWRDAAKALQAAHDDANEITRTIALIQLIDRQPAQIRTMARICEALTGDGEAKWTGKEMDVAATIAQHAPQLDMGVLKELL